MGRTRLAGPQGRSDAHRRRAAQGRNQGGTYARLKPVGQVDRPDQFLMPGNCEAVGHSGDIVANAAQPSRLSFSALPARRQMPGMVAVEAGEVTDDPLSLYSD